MHLHILALFTLFLPCAARGIMLAGHSGYYAQQQTKTLTKALLVSGDSRDAFLPGDFGTGVLHRRGQQAGNVHETYGQGPQLRGPHGQHLTTRSQAPARMTSSRRALLRRSALAAAATTLSAASAPVLAKDKGYLTMSEYQSIKRQEKKDEELYGLFESLRARAAQTTEFASLAEKDDLAGISKLAIAWDSSIRQPLLDKAAQQLEGGDKDRGNSLSKKVLKDLEQLDKLAKAGNKAAVADASTVLKGHVLDFVGLEPKRLQDKFGVSDL